MQVYQTEVTFMQPQYPTFAYQSGNSFLKSPRSEAAKTYAIVGMDCVEVTPVYNHAEITTNAAATFVWTYFCGVIAAQNKKLLA